MLSERELLDSLPFAEQCKEADAELLKVLYESKLKKYQAPAEYNLLVSCGALVRDRLRHNLDIQVAEAERLYYNCDYHQCFSLTDRFVTIVFSSFFSEYSCHYLLIILHYYIFFVFSLLKKDPYHSGCLPVHIACLVELKKTNGTNLLHIKSKFFIFKMILYLFE